jgi:hypothetical protein
MSQFKLPSVVCPAVPYFSTLSHKRHDFRRIKLLNVKCVIWSSITLLSETFTIRRSFERGVINMNRRLYKIPVNYVRFYENWIFSTDFRKKTRIPDFIKTCPMGAELFYADGRTDTQTDTQTDEANGHFLQFLRTHLKKNRSNINFRLKC